MVRPAQIASVEPSYSAIRPVTITGWRAIVVSCSNEPDTEEVACSNIGAIRSTGTG